MAPDRRGALEVPLWIVRRIAIDSAIVALVIAALFVGAMAGQA